MSERDYDVAVIGLGYVGLTLSAAMAEVGLKVCGVERRPEVVEMTNRGEPHFSESGLKSSLTRLTKSGALVAMEALEPNSSCGIYIITVGTPLGDNDKVRLDMIERASTQVAEHMSDGALVILRSTVKIGTARNVVTPILEATGKSFEIAMCPERTLEGRAMQELREIPQIVGADTLATRQRAGAIFRRLTKTIVDVSSLEAAEIVKLIDNTYRDVNFAFANEVARLCEAFDVNAMEVIGSGKLGYKRTNVALPGLVGGPCLEKDPHILRQSAMTKGIELEITAASRLVNERQPEETIDFVCAEMARRSLPADGVVALMGIAFKGVPATDDLRGAMSLKVYRALLARHPDLNIRIYDPVASTELLSSELPDCTVAESIPMALEGANVAIIANNHPELGKLSPVEMARMMADDGFVYDYWNHFARFGREELGDVYFSVGNTGRRNT